jgi:hypothetical protein
MVTNLELRDQEPKAIAWRYQRREGWGSIWRYTQELPIDFEKPEDWIAQPLYAGAPAPLSTFLKGK